MNKLYFGDCLDIMKDRIAAESIDLIYLDPPFNSKRNYNCFFDSDAQRLAFSDTWSWKEDDEQTYFKLIDPNYYHKPAGDKEMRMAKFIKSLYQILRDDQPGALSYLLFMFERLFLCHRVLKNSGSLYLHCDPTSSHYLKIMMDHIFGAGGFRNEIVWHYPSMSSTKKDFPKKHDTILRYSKSENCIFNADEVRIPYEASTLSRLKDGKLADGFFKGQDKTKDRTLNEKGKIPDTVWRMPIALGKERLGYPTQKPEALLERIIKASSNAGDTVLDPFCGCGTCVAVAEKLGRKWVGIDVTYVAISLIRERIKKINPNANIQITGMPTVYATFKNLIDQEKDRYGAEWFLAEKLGFQTTMKKGSDRGIDGRKFFKDGDSVKQMILQVKTGKVNSGNIRDLIGVLRNEGAEIGVFVTYRSGSKDMKNTALKAGHWTASDGKRYPMIQILTVEDVFNGKGLNISNN